MGEIADQDYDNMLLNDESYNGKGVKMEKKIPKVEDFKGAIIEIGTGKVMVPKNDADVAWNGACDKCIRLIQKYMDGSGLFQLGDSQT